MYFHLIFVLWTIRSLHPHFTGEVSSKCIHREFFSLFILDPFLLSDIKYMKKNIYIKITRKQLNCFFFCFVFIKISTMHSRGGFVEGWR